MPVLIGFCGCRTIKNELVFITEFQVVYRSGQISSGLTPNFFDMARSILGYGKERALLTACLLTFSSQAICDNDESASRS